MANPWTPIECAFLKLNFPTSTSRQMAECLPDRTNDAVRQKLARMGLSRRDQRTQDEFGRRIGDPLPVRPMHGVWCLIMGLNG